MKRNDLNNFIRNKENTMNAYTGSCVEQAFLALKNKYLAGNQAPDNNLLEKELKTIFKKFKQYDLFNESDDSKYFQQQILNRLKRIHLCHNFSLAEVCITVFRAVCDNSIKFIDSSNEKDRLIKLKKRFEETLSEANCNVGLENKLLDVLHNSYPGIYIISHITSDLKKIAVKFYQEKLSQLAKNSQKYYLRYKQLFLISVGGDIGEQAEEELNNNFYKKTELEIFLTEKMKKLLGEVNYQRLEKDIIEKIDYILFTVDELPVPIQKAHKKTLKKLETLLTLSHRKKLPKALSKHFNTLTTIDALRQDVYCDCYLLLQQLHKSNQTYLPEFFIPVGKEYGELQEIALQIQKIYKKINHHFSENIKLHQDVITNAYNQLQQLESQIIKTHKEIAKKKDVLIENSFATMAAIETEKERLKYFEQMLQHFFKTGGQVTEKILEKWLRSKQKINDDTNTYEITPTVEQLNRLFWTAITTVPMSWSPQFALLLQTSLDYLEKVDKGEVQPSNQFAQAVKKGSYLKLLPQLKWLLSIHRAKNGTITVPDDNLWLPCNLGKINLSDKALQNFCDKYPYSQCVIAQKPQWLDKNTISYLIDFDQLLSALKSLPSSTEKAELVKQHIDKIERYRQLEDLLTKLEKSERFEIVKLYLDKIDIDSSNLVDLFTLLPKNKGVELFQSHWKKIEIYYLSKIFKFLPANIDLELEKKYINKVSNYRELRVVLKLIPNDKKLIFAERCSDKIKNTNQLIEVIKLLPQNHRLQFIEKCQHKIKDAYELSQIIIFLPNNQNLEFIEKYKYKIKNFDEVILIAQLLPEHQTLAFVEEFADKIKNGDQLNTIINLAPKNKRAKLAEKYQDKIQTIYDLSKVSRFLPNNKKLELIEKYKHKIKNFDEVILIAQMLPEDQTTDFVEKLSDKIAPNITQIINIIKILPNHQRLSFTERCSDKIKNASQLIEVIKLLPKNQKMIFAEKHSKIIRNGEELFCIAMELPYDNPEIRLKFVNTHSNKINNSKELFKLFNLHYWREKSSENKYLDFVRENKLLINNIEDLKELLEKLPEADQKTEFAEDYFNQIIKKQITEQEIEYNGAMYFNAAPSKVFKIVLEKLGIISNYIPKDDRVSFSNQPYILAKKYLYHLKSVEQLRDIIDVLSLDPEKTTELFKKFMETIKTKLTPIKLCPTVLSSIFHKLSESNKEITKETKKELFQLFFKNLPDKNSKSTLLDMLTKDNHIEEKQKIELVKQYYKTDKEFITPKTLSK